MFDHARGERSWRRSASAMSNVRAYTAACRARSGDDQSRRVTNSETDTVPPSVKSAKKRGAALASALAIIEGHTASMCSELLRGSTQAGIFRFLFFFVIRGRREAGACQRRRGPARCGHRSRHCDLRRRSRAGTRSQSRLARAHRSPSHAHEVMPARLLPRDRYESAHITPSTAGGRPEPPQAGRTRRHRRPKNP